MLIGLRKGKRLDSHMGNFIECVRDRAMPVSDVFSHHRNLTTCHLANIAIRLGRNLTWDPVKEEIVGDDEANAMQRREQRSGYSADLRHEFRVTYRPCSPLRVWLLEAAIVDPRIPDPFGASPHAPHSPPRHRLRLPGPVLAVPVRAEEFFFKNGDRVVMMGDSITEQHLYSNYVEMWTVTPLPGLGPHVSQRRHRRRPERRAATAASSATRCPTSRRR